MVWTSNGQDGDISGVFGQRFGRPALLRNDEVTSIDPVTPPRATILPLDPSPAPAGDRYIEGFVSGDADPAPSAGPLVFYGLDSPITTLKLTKSGGSVLIAF